MFYIKLAIDAFLLFAYTMNQSKCKNHQHKESNQLDYEGCSNMNASSFITFFPYMLLQNGKRFYKGLYVTIKLAPGLKKNKVCLSSYSPLNESHVSILTNSMLRTYTSDIGFDKQVKFLGIIKEVSPYSYIMIL